jgi:ribosomal protein S18 acetylase RimI-like enzyme
MTQNKSPVHNHMGLQIVLLDGRIHGRETFTCGTPPLDVYIRQQASQHQRDGIATTHVLCDTDAPSKILGYCTFSAAQLLLSDLNESDRKRLPAYPVPAMRIGRLAVSLETQGKGYGELLLGHAVNSALDLRSQLGIRVIVVDAKDEHAAGFYEKFGFRPTASSAMTLYLPLGLY